MRLSKRIVINAQLTFCACKSQTRSFFSGAIVLRSKKQRRELQKQRSRAKQRYDNSIRQLEQTPKIKEKDLAFSRRFLPAFQSQTDFLEQKCRTYAEWETNCTKDVKFEPKSSLGAAVESLQEPISVNPNMRDIPSEYKRKVNGETRFLRKSTLQKAERHLRAVQIAVRQALVQHPLFEQNETTKKIYEMQHELLSKAREMLIKYLDTFNDDTQKKRLVNHASVSLTRLLKKCKPHVNLEFLLFRHEQSIQSYIRHLTEGKSSKVITRAEIALIKKAVKTREKADAILKELSHVETKLIANQARLMAKANKTNETVDPEWVRNIRPQRISLHGATIYISKAEQKIENVQDFYDQHVNNQPSASKESESTFYESNDTQVSDLAVQKFFTTRIEQGLADNFDSASCRLDSTQSSEPQSVDELVESMYSQVAEKTKGEILAHDSEQIEQVCFSKYEQNSNLQNPLVKKGDNFISGQSMIFSRSMSLSSDRSSDNLTSFGYREVPKKDKEKLVGDVFTSVASKYDQMNDAMSFGIHRIWKNHFVSRLNPVSTGNGLNIIDVAGGTGDIAFRMLEWAEKHGDVKSKVIVADINTEMLKQGVLRSKKKEYSRFRKRLEFIEQNAEILNEIDSQSIDLYTICFGIRNCTNIDRVLAQAYRVLKPGGLFACMEFSKVHPLLDPLYEKYSFRIIPLLGSIIAGDRDSYQYLAESIRRFPDQKTFHKMIEAAGFQTESDAYENLSFGVVAIHTGIKAI